MNSRARIATVAQNRRFFPTVEKNREHVMGLLDRALQHKPDLVCLPEAFPTVAVPGKTPDAYAEPVPGPTIDAAAKRARKGRCYVVCPLTTKRDGRCWNSAVILDRKGAVAGIYDKVWPVTTTPDYTLLEDGITPGSELPVFDLDFGRVGIQICFDKNFRESWAALGQKGARLVLWPSAYPGGFPLQAYAWAHEYYVVSSVRSGASRIVNPCGEIVAKTDDWMEVIWKDVNLDYIVAHLDFNYTVTDELHARYGDGVNVRVYAEEGLFFAEPLAEGLTSEQLRRECRFESCGQYLARHREAAPHLRAGRPAPAQEAAHGRRAQYSK